MKKLWLLTVILSVVILLTACKPPNPEGMGESFYYNASDIFTEIDEDTQEGELSDRDDLGNLDILDAKAVTDREKEYVVQMYRLVDLQAKVYDRDNEALKEYIQVRRDVASILEDDIYEFEFTEED